MQRITITLDDDLIERFEAFIAEQGYNNRSEAFRDLVRERLARIEPDQATSGDGFAILNYVYNHHQRDLAARMAETSHANHDLTVSTLHVHLDHDNCLESAVLRGPVSRIQAFAAAVISQPGVRHGRLYLLPAETSAETHTHGTHEHAHSHVHLVPKV